MLLNCYSKLHLWQSLLSDLYLHCNDVLTVTLDMGFLIWLYMFIVMIAFWSSSPVTSLVSSSTSIGAIAPLAMALPAVTTSNQFTPLMSLNPTSSASMALANGPVNQLILRPSTPEPATHQTPRPAASSRPRRNGDICIGKWVSQGIVSWRGANLTMDLFISNVHRHVTPVKAAILEGPVLYILKF